MRLESLLRRLVEELAYWRPSKKIVGCPGLVQLVKKFGFVVGLPWPLAKYDEPVSRIGVHRRDEQERIRRRLRTHKVSDSDSRASQGFLRFPPSVGPLAEIGNFLNPPRTILLLETMLYRRWK